MMGQVEIARALQVLEGLAEENKKLFGFEGLIVDETGTSAPIDYIAEIRDYEYAKKIISGWLDENKITHIEFAIE